ncbi:hypothetical protein RRF57_006278 [Xylaria bambusicola]|uniref:Uncharacterized protein n=1 Tax=Xylaria bambusicola TaxID=326684 RepID=A0AAN7Z8V2_9PEZI
MPPQSHSPPITRCLLVATLFTLVFFATVSLSDSFASISYQGSNSSPEGEAPEPALEKRLLGLGGVVGLVPSLLGNIVPGGIVSSLVAQVTADINSLLPILDEPSAKNPDGMPLLTGAQAALSLTAQPLPTAAQLGGLADKLGGILNGIVPVAAPSIIAAITEQALGVVASVEAIATDVASLGNQIGSGPMQGSDALGQIGGLLGSLDAKVNDIVNGVTSNLGSDLPLSVLQDIGQVISSGLGDIVGAANGPLSLVGDLIEHDVCGAVTTVDGVLATVAGLCGDIPSAVAQVSSELATATLINPDAVLTGDTSAITIFPTSPGITTAPAITAVSTLPSSNSQDQSIPANPPNGSTGGSGSNLTGNGATPSPSNQSSLSNIGSGPSLSSTQASPAQPSVTSKAPGSSGGGSFTIASSLSTFGSPSPEPASVPNTALTSSPSMAGPAQPGVGGTSQTTTTGGKLRAILEL